MNMILAYPNFTGIIGFVFGVVLMDMICCTFHLLFLYLGQAICVKGQAG
jgi:hypothetical protein